MKFEGTDFAEEVRTADEHAGTAKMLGQSSYPPLREDWEDVKEAVMREALFAKFSQHQNLQQILLSTENRLLIENSKRDRYWGDGGDLSGKNRLGYCLMQVRNQLRALPNGPAAPQPT